VIAEKLEPLIAAAAPCLGEAPNMRQRALEDRLVGERVADLALELVAGSSPSGSSNDREQPAQRTTHGQRQTFQAARRPRPRRR
jgi:hypothetical protein